MRSNLLLFALLFAGTLAAQNYTQNALPVQQTQPAADCYTRQLDQGNAALRRGEAREALRHFEEAKNCPGADQKTRQQMSEKISACRNAAENELFAKQQEAERQARHAIAANLADDAQELLRSEDRSLAFRLADFANQYIAPDDNQDCVQAMLDACVCQVVFAGTGRLAGREPNTVKFGFVLLLSEFKNTLTMSVLEMKGELHDLLAQVNEESQLEKIRVYVLRLLNTATRKDYDGLTEAQYAELQLAIEESEDEGNLVSSEEVFKRFEQWIGR